MIFDVAGQREQRSVKVGDRLRQAKDTEIADGTSERCTVDRFPLLHGCGVSARAASSRCVHGDFCRLLMDDVRAGEDEISGDRKATAFQGPIAEQPDDEISPGAHPPAFFGSAGSLFHVAFRPIVASAPAEAMNAFASALNLIPRVISSSCGPRSDSALRMACAAGRTADSASSNVFVARTTTP